MKDVSRQTAQTGEILAAGSTEAAHIFSLIKYRLQLVRHVVANDDLCDSLSAERSGKLRAHHGGFIIAVKDVDEICNRQHSCSRKWCILLLVNITVTNCSV